MCSVVGEQEASEEGGGRREEGTRGEQNMEEGGRGGKWAIEGST
jgi:hypothetical protein